ncbi:hypothetical protein [Sorangium sp. So ce590]|uniref:hypothetical protein n=1 Tax=unclassified Sorangium TaxID=2621164 RepID=UPI003F5E422B
MNLNPAILIVVALPLASAGCGTAPGVDDPKGAPPCDGPSTCGGDPVPESVCLQQLAKGQLVDGCGVFVNHPFFGGDDANPGTKDRPVRSLQRGIELARTGRGRVFATSDGFEESITLPSGVDIYGGFNVVDWEPLKDTPRPSQGMSKVLPSVGQIALIVEPAHAGDTGAADGVSIIDHMFFSSQMHVGMIVRSGTAVEIVGSWIESDYGLGGHDGDKSPGRAVSGPDGQVGGDACSAATVPGGVRAVNSCEGGIPRAGGKGGDGLADGAGDGEDGEPVPEPNPQHEGLEDLATGQTGIVTAAPPGKAACGAPRRCGEGPRAARRDRMARRRGRRRRPGDAGPRRRRGRRASRWARGVRRGHQGHQGRRRRRLRRRGRLRGAGRPRGRERAAEHRDRGAPREGDGAR